MMAWIRRQVARETDHVTGRRNHALIAMRRRRSEALRWVTRVARRLPTPAVDGSIVVWPPPSSPEQAADLATRASWSLLGAGTERQVDIAFDAGRLGAVPEYLDPSNLPSAVRWRPQIRRADLLRASMILVWRPEALLSPWLVPVMDRVLVVAPSFFNLTEIGSWEEVARRCVSPDLAGELEDEGHRNLERLLREAGRGRTVNVLGNGPSVDEVYGAEVGGDFNIVCNSAVRSRRLLEHVRPRVVACADPVFHFGPSRYAAQFRRDLVEAAEAFDFFVAVSKGPQHHWLAGAAPALRSRLVPLEHVFEGAPTVPTLEAPKVLSTGNILTLFMLPLAMAVAADTIQIWGCDGRDPSEKYFWKHNASVQYDGLMKTVFEAHPSFFRDRVYSDYYDQHCAMLERMAMFAEQRGARVASCSVSHIPALINRASEPASAPDTTEQA